MSGSETVRYTSEKIRNRFATKKKVKQEATVPQTIIHTELIPWGVDEPWAADEAEAGERAGEQGERGDDDAEFAARHEEVLRRLRPPERPDADADAEGEVDEQAGQDDRVAALLH